MIVTHFLIKRLNKITLKSIIRFNETVIAFTLPYVFVIGWISFVIMSDFLACLQFKYFIQNVSTSQREYYLIRVYRQWTLEKKPEESIKSGNSRATDNIRNKTKTKQNDEQHAPHQQIRGWTQMLANGKQFLSPLRHPPCTHKVKMCWTFKQT
jgi:hypothetical protein